MANGIGRRAELACLVVLNAFISVPAASAAAPCSTPEHRQFDFWAGSWDVYETTGTEKVAHVNVDHLLDGCVLREDYQQADGLRGQSLTIYDPARDVWHQSWVTNRGQMLELDGKLDGQSIILNGEDHARNALVRGTWTAESGNVREIAVISTDRGKTWKPWFDLMFRPAEGQSANPEQSAEKKAIQELDRRYQQAVKENDAATMDQILADEFTLVTGSGKTYSKADLLEEARSGRMRYERQDDADSLVRMWGDTAVITAKLTAKGTEAGKSFNYEVWFTDVYIKKAPGWRYVFGQSSSPIKKSAD